MSGVLLGSIVLPAVLFGVVYYPTLNKLARGLASPYAKADIGRRFCAVMVDSLFVMTGWFFYRQSESVLYLLAGLLYVLLRDSTFGRSIGKFLFGLVVIDLETGRPCGRAGSAKRNVLFLLPGANLSAAFLEAVTIVRDPQGQRLGDRVAQTQVVEGFGVRDLAAGFQRWWRDFIAQLDGTPRRPRRVPVKSEPGQSTNSTPVVQGSTNREVDTAMLFHVSEEPGIERFEPRASEYAVEPAVWAIDAERLRNYLVPRECPRVTYYANGETAAADVERFLGSSTAVVAVENGWLEQLRSRRLYCYHLPPETFECLDECAGYFVSRVPVVPERVEIFDDPLAELLRRGVELRFVPNLWPLRDAVVASTLRFSLIRMRNALPRSTAYATRL